jgi:hypothetical protein
MARCTRLSVAGLGALVAVHHLHRIRPIIFEAGASGAQAKEFPMSGDIFEE